MNKIEEYKRDKEGLDILDDMPRYAKEGWEKITDGDKQRMNVGNKAFHNLTRKFNVTITACKEACTHAEAQDLALTPALKEIAGVELKGFNVAVGGKLGSGGFRMASPLDLFVTVNEAASI